MPYLRRFARAVAALALAGTLAACGGEAVIGRSNLIGVEDLGKVQRGMSQDEARKVLGPPTQVDQMGRGRGAVWTYNYIDRTQLTPHMQLFIWFDPATGTVTRTESGFNPAFNPGGGR
jgi:outer membrane protein assembly factor BamE (lipoprotein component of BamABCDE complex)